MRNEVLLLYEILRLVAVISVVCNPFSAIVGVVVVGAALACAGLICVWLRNQVCSYQFSFFICFFLFYYVGRDRVLCIIQLVITRAR